LKYLSQYNSLLCFDPPCTETVRLHHQQQDEEDEVGRWRGDGAAADCRVADITARTAAAADADDRGRSVVVIVAAVRTGGDAAATDAQHCAETVVGLTLHLHVPTTRSCWLVGVEFNAPLDTIYVISEAVFTANHLTDTDKQNSTGKYR